MKHLGLKVPEPAINTAIMTVFIGKLSADLNIYKLDGAEELYFGTGEPEKLAIVGRSPVRPSWESRGGFEMSTLIRPFLENVPNRLGNYIVESTQQSTTWERLNELVYTVVLELLQDLGDFARRESGAGRTSGKPPLTKPSAGCIVGDMTEMILTRLSDKLRQEYGTLTTTLSLN